MAAKLSLRPVLGYLHQFCEQAGQSDATDRDLLHRFSKNGDQEAFRTLVHRHGALVLGVSMRALRHRQDAEDCFQATFMVLARKAGTVAWQESISPWLHQVATRIAAEIRTRAARRQLHERRAVPTVAPSSDDVGLRDLAAAVDNEIQRLPERLRSPLLLCYLQGLTRDQAAQTLGWSLRTLERRLQDGRNRLQANLLRRGITLSAALAAWSLASVADAAVRATLAADTATTACAFATASVTGVSGELAAHVVRAMAWEKSRCALGIIAAVSICIAGLATGMLSSAPFHTPEQPAFEQVGDKQDDTPKQPVRRVQEVGVASAVQDGLRWIVRNQRVDGGWQFDAGQPNDTAATALALLPLLEASEGPPLKGPQKQAVQRGLTYLAGRQKADGSFDGGMYAHAMAAWALCDGYRRAGNPNLKKSAQQAIDYIVGAQHEQGGWRYAPKQPGDTSVSTWHIIAIHRGKQAGLNVPANVFAKASAFLDKVASDGDSAYCYTPQARATPSMTAGGLHCRILLGWKSDHAALQKGAVHLLKEGPNAKVSNAYYYHFGTRAMHGIGGPEWERWESRMASLLLQRQEHGGADDGSWPVAGDAFGSAGGRQFVTSLSLLSLQLCGRLDAVPANPPKLTPAEAATQWQDLRSDDFGKIRPAMRLLVGAPDQALPLLRQHLRPSKAGDPKLIDPLVADLGSSAFAKRQRAVDQLKAIGEAAIPSLRKALDSKIDLEHRRRIEDLLALATAIPQSPELVRALRGLQVLELIGTPEARGLIAELAKGSPGIGLTDAASDALKRLGN